MKNSVKCLLAFTFGAAVGVAASWKYMELKYRQIADAEIESVKEVYSSKPVEEDIEEADEEDEQVVEKTEEKVSEKPNTDVTAYHQIINTVGYHNNYSTISKEGTPSDEGSFDKPYIIDEGEVGECDYEVINLTYYEGDNTLADDLDELVDDVEETVGWANLEKFGEYDSICVRNDARRVDFEILLDVRSFADVTYLRGFEG